MKVCRLLCLCFIVIFVLTTQAVAESPITLVTLHYPPLEYEENGKVIGIAVEIVHEAFQRMSQPITVKVFPWLRALSMIEEGEADAVFTAAKTPEREVFADFSQEVLIYQVISLFVLKDSPIIFDGDFNKLKDYHFGIIYGTKHGEIADNALKQMKYVDAGAKTPEQNVQKLLGKRFDIWLGSRYIVLHTLNQMNQPDAVKELSPEVDKIPTYIAFSKKRQLSAVRDKFDATLKAMRTDGTYNKIIDKFLQK
jgi:polar amino acid transport system substrate-binding protein